MERSDTNGDGKLSADEISAISEERRGNITAADSDGDGSVTSEELTAQFKKVFGN